MTVGDGRRGGLGLIVVGAVAAGAIGQEVVRDHDIVLEDYFSQGFVSAMAVAPDGRHVAYVEGRWDADLDRRNLDLWVVATDTKKVRRLTFDPGNDTAPVWGGDWVYFLSKRARPGATQPPYDGKTQVWRVPVDGGAASPVTRVKDGVQTFALAADGETLYYVAGRKHVEPDAWKSLREQFGDLEYGHGTVTFGVLWSLDLETWRAAKLVDEQRVIGAIAVSPSGGRVAMVTAPTEELISTEGWSHMDVYDAATGGVTRLEDRLWRAEAPSPYGWIVSPAWSDDGGKLAFRVDFDGYPGEIFVAHFDVTAAGGDVPVSRLVRPRAVSVEGTMAWTPGAHDLCFVADDHARARVEVITAITPAGQGRPRTASPGDVVVENFGFARAARTPIVLMRSLTHPPDFFRIRDDWHAREASDLYERLTRLNPQVDTWKIPQIRLVTWTSRDGTEVEGILELPPDYDGVEPLPTVVAIHGGPTASSKYAYRFWIYGRTLLPAQGYAVFDPNYRGSTGYGDKFLTDLIENKNNLDVQDILAGVDHLVREGIADPDRLAVMGWSNGGYLTNCLIAATDRFKAASSGAGVFDTVMQWSIEDTPGHVINYAGGLPWERGAKMHETSPLYAADRISTPTLIHVGAKDARTPVAHSRALHRALHHYLDVPAELVVYPGEGHGLTKRSHRKAKMTWDLGWFEHFVLGRSDEATKGRSDGAAKPGS